MWQNCARVIFETAKSYVFTTANNLLLNEYKHQKVVLKFQEKPQADRTLEDPAYLMEEREWKDKIEAAIAALPEKQRVVFLMSRVDKKTYQEISEVIGISKQAVEKRIYLALATLREVSKRIK